MPRFRELALRLANAGLISSLNWLHRHYPTPPTYRLADGRAAVMFEGAWFAYSPREFGATGNIDYVADAENETRSALLARIRDGQVFYDIGAHGGVYTITVQRQFANVIIHSFEPQASELLVNLSLNGLPTSYVHEVAVGATEGVVRMTTKRRSSNYVCDHGELEVRMVRLDDYVRENNLPSPDWIKIDIEGLELPALRSAHRILEQARPIVICEINQLFHRFGSTISDFTGYMRSLRYEPHRLLHGALERIDRADTLDDLGFSADNNFWFLPERRDLKPASTS